MKYCKKCLQPNTRPGVYFNGEQVCGACLYEEEKSKIDWTARKRELNDISEWAKAESKKRGTAYDCVIGVSGGKDSTFQAFYAKEKLGLHPLLVCCVPDEITETGRKNMDNLLSYGFDLIQIRTDPVIARALAKKGFYEYGNIQKASEYSLWASAFRIAAQWNISLVIQGENAALTLGVSKDLDRGSDASDVFNNNTLGGGSADIWASEDIPPEKLYFYNAPSKKELAEKNIKSIYLQYYLDEWSQAGNADFAVARGLMGRTQEDLHDIGRFRRYSALDSDQGIPNQMLKYLKFGFGFATDEACYDIREGRITREDAIWLVKEYDGKCAKRYIEGVCKYMGISLQEFWNVADRYVNRKLFYKDDKTGEWIPKFTVGEDFD